MNGDLAKHPKNSAHYGANRRGAWEMRNPNAGRGRWPPGLYGCAYQLAGSTPVGRDWSFFLMGTAKGIMPNSMSKEILGRRKGARLIASQTKGQTTGQPLHGGENAHHYLSSWNGC